jgi:hypothetical protein
VAECRLISHRISRCSEPAGVDMSAAMPPRRASKGGLICNRMRVATWRV